MRTMMRFAMTLLLMTISGAQLHAQGAAKIRVGLLTDEVSTDERSREAAWKILSTTDDFDAKRITGADVRGGVLSNLDVIVFPGGSGSGEAKSLGVEGGKLVTEFVRNGKGAIGICAGGYLFTEGWTDETRAIELTNAESFDDKHWARGEQFINVRLVPGASWNFEEKKVRGAVAANDAETSHTMWFENGPLFAPGTRTDIPQTVPLVEYVSDVHKPDAPAGMMPGRAAAVANPFGKGRVVTFGPHPELSPGLAHWLQNAIRWSVKGEVTGAMSDAMEILEGRAPAAPPKGV